MDETDPAGDGPWADLAARVARLEQLVTPEPATEPRPGDNTFWALAGLKAHQAEGVVYAGVVQLPTEAAVEWQMGHSSQALLDEEWADRATVLASLGHPVRLRILQLVARGEHTTAAELVEVMGAGTTGQIYHHLRQLVAAGWLRSTTKGRHQIPPERLVPLLVILDASH